METAFNELVRNIAAYFNIVPNETDKKRLEFYVRNYLAAVQPKTSPIPKIINTERIVYVPVISKEYIPKNKPRTLMDANVCKEYMATLAKQICVKYGITEQQLKRNSPIDAYFKGRRAKREYVDARHEFSLIAIAAGCRTTEIGEFLGYTDHCTIIHFSNHRKQKEQPIAI